MNILKMGSDHIFYGINCQDATLNNENIKVLCDGCSEGKHSEVGAKLFCKMLETNYNNAVKNEEVICTYKLINDTMAQVLRVTGMSLEEIKNYALFTIFTLEKYENIFEVFFCGDGYIIKIVDNNVIYEKIDCGEYPQYLAYNYCNDKEKLKCYKDGVIVYNYAFSCDEYDKIGIASDGLRFIVDRPDDDPLKIEFNKLLLSGKETKTKLFINKHKEIFKDDISILI